MSDNKNTHTSNHTSEEYPLYKISSRCSSGGCVGVAFLDESVSIKNTSDETQSPISFTHEEWRIFIEGVKNQEFDTE